MMRVRLIGLMLFLAGMLIPLASAQDGGDIIEPVGDAMVNADANISFPPPVYVVSENVEIRGTVTLPNMRNFFVQFRSLVLDDAETEEADWFPAILSRPDSVADDVLGVWNTRMTPDGLYELRLTVNTDGDQVYARVSPIRIENNPPAFLQAEMEMAEGAAADDEMAEGEAAEGEADEGDEMVIEVDPPEEAAPEEPAPTPTPEDTSPRATAIVDSHVRAGDSTQYQRVGFMLTGETAKILGISSRNTGWYFIEMASGRTGFIHPGIVRAEGDLSNLDRIAPPPPPPPTPVPIIPTAVPAPAAQPAPASSNANLVMENVVIRPHPAVCGEAYRIEVTVRNNGSAATTSGGVVRVTDTRHDGAQPTSTNIGFGALAAGGTQRVFGHLTTSTYYNERHNINLRLDANNQVPESNENDNLHATAPYILQRGKC